jgi:Na+-driven multidrug efflux pump
MGISMAATAIVARRISEEDVEGAKNNIVQVIYIGILVSICFGVIGI